MMEGERVNVEKEAIGEVSDVDCTIAFGVNADGTLQQVSGWVMPVLELERIARGRDQLVEPHDFYIHDNDSSEPIHPAELRYVTNLCVHTWSDRCTLAL